jgi:hypothetical protein
MAEHRVQVQGLSDEDYDKVYRAGYEDGIDQARYVSDHEVAEIQISIDEERKVITLFWDGGDKNLALISKAGVPELLQGPPEGWKYEFINF